MDTTLGKIIKRTWFVIAYCLIGKRILLTSVTTVKYMSFTTKRNKRFIWAGYTSVAEGLTKGLPKMEYSYKSYCTFVCMAHATTLPTFPRPFIDSHCPSTKSVSLFVVDIGRLQHDFGRGVIFVPLCKISRSQYSAAELQSIQQLWLQLDII